MRFIFACWICVAFVSMTPAIQGQDRSKRVIEVPVEAIVEKAAVIDELLAGPEILDLSKFTLERPVKGMLAGSEKQKLALPAVPVVEKESANPRVEPGKVSWHVDFSAATVASKQSGKPVLHFQLLGQLDQRFT